jgi:hypothetical protein
MQHATSTLKIFMRDFALESQAVPVSVENLIPGFTRNHGVIALLSLVLCACGRSTRNVPERISLWTVPAPTMSDSVAARLRPVDAYPDLGMLIALDSASLRPGMTRRGGSGYVERRVNDSTWAGIHLDRPVTVTTYQGSRYHPETIRALANDSTVMATAATSIVRAGRASRLILDFQSGTTSDIQGLVKAMRAIRDADARAGARGLAVVVPWGDTAAYPTLPLSRVANILVIRLHGEHRPGTPPGPLATPDFIARAIGIRARLVGASRLGAELPLYGYLWNRDGSARLITYADAQSLVRAESGVFTRDPVSSFLTARGRDGWTIWVPDARTVQAMALEVKRRGVAWITLAGPEGADPAIFTSEGQTTIRSF